MNSKTKIPNLFIVGEQKSGTTTLHYQLSQHSEIFMSAIKEPGYFCTDLQVESDEFHGKKLFFPIRTRESYLKLYDDTNDEKYLGEASSTYLYSRKAAEEIYNFNPNAKIIIMLREPVNFLYSLHSQYIKEAIEDIEDFEQAFKAEPDRKKGQKLSKRVNVPSLLFYSERIKYTQNLERYFKLFPKDQIKIIFFEEYIKDTTNQLEDILNFLGVNANLESIDLEAKNINKQARNKFLNKLINSPALIGVMTRILPNKLQLFLVDFKRKIFLKSAKREPIDPDLRLELKKRFASEVEKLQKFLNSQDYDIDLRELWS